MKTNIEEIEIPEKILETIASNPGISLDKSGLLEFINTQLDKRPKSKVIWELFLRTKYLILERVENE